MKLVFSTYTLYFTPSFLSFIVEARKKDPLTPESRFHASNGERLRLVKKTAGNRRSSSSYGGGDGRISSSQKISRLILWVDNFSTCPYFKRSQNGCQSNLYKNISCQIDRECCYPGYHALPDDHPDCPLSAQLSFNGRHRRHTRRIQQTEHEQARRRQR